MPDSAVLQFTNPFEHQASILNSDVEVLVTNRGDYYADLTRIRLHHLFMQRGREMLSHVDSGAVTGVRRPVFFLDDADQPPFFHSGRQLEQDQILFLSPSAEYHHRTAGPSQWCAMSLTPDDLAAAGRAITGHDLVAPAVTRSIWVPLNVIARLRALHRAAGHLAATAPDILAHPEVARVMEQELVLAMVRCLSEGLAIGTDTQVHRRLTVMQRFKQILYENENPPRYMAELCAAMGVPERTLRLHCIEHLGMAPHRYLWLRRLHQARRALSLATPAATTVTAIACDYGFWELGRFASEYCQLFGELPSVTLRRAPDLPAKQAPTGVSTAFADFA
ncbi:MAG: helix-turn-helix domain-containing protein [Rhodopila sp.]